MNEVQQKLQESFGLKNKLAVPRLKKIVLSIGLGEAKDNAGILDKVKVYFVALGGQAPVVTVAKKSIAAFKVSEGQPIGMMMTLRGDRMYAFLDKLVSVVFPKVRDFRGISADCFDSHGNLNIGLKEQTIFPEVNYKSVDRVRGLAVTIATTARNRGGHTAKEEGRQLLELLGMPFKGGLKL